MAIHINKKFTLNGIVIPELYGRIEFMVDMKSTFIMTTIHFFINNYVYHKNNGVSDTIFIPEVQEYIGNKISYNPTKDGTDLIPFIHDKLVEILTTDESHQQELYYQENIVLLDTEGNPMLNENNEPIYKHKAGEPILDENGIQQTETIITKVKLCDKIEITIVDIN